MAARDANTSCGLADLFLRGYILESDIRPDGSVPEDVRREAERRYLRMEDHIHRLRTRHTPGPRPRSATPSNMPSRQQVWRIPHPMLSRPVSASDAREDTTVTSRANELMRRRRETVPLPVAESQSASPPPVLSSKSDDMVTVEDSPLDMTLRRSSCVVCLTSKRSYACTPCGHLALCDRCQLRVRDVCPICRAPDVTMVRIFLS